MKRFEISDKLQKILKKLLKKDKRRYEIILKKIEEIVGSDVNRYKNLSHDMKDFKRVHIDSHFVLIFLQKGDIVQFLDLQHHDHIYQNIYIL